MEIISEFSFNVCQCLASVQTGSRGKFESRSNDDGWGDSHSGFGDGFGSSTGGGFTGMSAAVDDEDWG